MTRDPEEIELRVVGPFAVVKGAGGTTWGDLTHPERQGHELPTGGPRFIVGIGRCEVTVGDEEHVRLLARLHDARRNAKSIDDLLAALPEPYRSDTIERLEDGAESDLDALTLDLWMAADWLNQTMLELVPDDIVDRYGEMSFSGADGPCVILFERHFSSIVEELSERGFDLVIDHELIRRADGSDL